MDKASIRKNRFFFIAVIISILNPIFSGLILGIFMFLEPDLKKEGRIVTLFSVVWGIIVMMLLARFGPSLPI